MKRILAILLLSTTAWAASITARVGTSATTNVSSYTSGSFTPAAGDLMVALVYATGTVDTGAMSDTQGLGFAMSSVTFTGAAGNTGYVFVAQRLAAATSMTVTFQCPNDAATGAIIQVFSISGMTRVGPSAIRQFVVVNSHATSTPATTFTASALTGNPTISFVGNASSPGGLTAPTSWTVPSGSSGTGCNNTPVGSTIGNCGYSTPTTGTTYATRDSGFTGTTITWGSSSSAWGGASIEFDTSAAPTVGFWPNCGATAPCVIQDVQTNSPNEATGPAFYLRFPNLTLAGNLLILRLMYDQQETTSTVTSDCGGTWTEGPHEGAGSNQEQFDTWYLLNNAGSCQMVTVTLSGALSGNLFFTAGLTEVSGIATTSAIDGTSTISGTSGPVIQPGSITTTQSGDFVYNAIGWNHPFDPIILHPAVAAMTPDSNSVLILAHPWVRMGAAFQIQAASGAINPTFYADDPDGAERGWHSAALAFKADTSKGAQPTANTIRILRMMWAYNNIGAATVGYQFPTAGNLRVVYSATDVGEGYVYTSPTDNDGAYTVLANTTNCTGSYSNAFPQFLYSFNKSANQINYFTVQQAQSSWFTMIDVANASTSPFDTCTIANGTQSGSSADITSAPTYTPGQAKELVIGVNTVANGPSCGTIINSPAVCNSSSTVGYTYDAVWSTAATDLGNLAFGDNYSHTYTTTTSALNFGYHMANGVISTWHGVAIGFKQVPAAAGSVRRRASVVSR